MVPKHFFGALALMIPFFLPFHTSHAAEGPLKGSVKAFRVVRAANDDEVFLPAEKARPKDLIEYRLTYRNKGLSPVKSLAITDPIPLGTVYVAQSAIAPPSGGIEFSVDGGKSYHPWPVRISVRTADGKKKTQDATPEMVTHIRWDIDGDLGPDEEITVLYRVSVK